MSATLFPFSANDVNTAGDLAPFAVRLGDVRPGHAVYVRRRLMVALLFIGLLAVIGMSARTVLADRGGVPASTPAIRPATVPPAVADAVAGAATAPLAIQLGTPPPVAAGAVQYIVQPGDSLWTLAEVFHGQRSVSGWVDAMVETNGGASLQVGQLLTLP